MSQPRRHSMWEVGLDFGLGTAVSLGIQALLFHTFTLPRGLGFTGILLLLALARRYSLRRGFNWLVRQGQRQSWRMSLLEAVVDAWCARLLVSRRIVAAHERLCQGVLRADTAVAVYASSALRVAPWNRTWMEDVRETLGSRRAGIMKGS